MMKIIKNLLILSFWLSLTYLALFHQDATQNIAFVVEHFGNIGRWVINIFLIAFVSLVSLHAMEICTGKFGLQKIKKSYVALFSVAGLSLFAFMQFFDALGTSSAEGATVVIEVWRQLVTYFQHGQIENYGLVGMLTSDASGPWNHSIFPMIIMGYYFLKRKVVALSERHLHISMGIMSVLYAEQFFFSLDTHYSLLEVIIMLVTSSIFVIGMFSFLLKFFQEVGETEEEEDEDENPGRSIWSKYNQKMNLIAMESFKIFTFFPGWKLKDEVKTKFHFFTNALQTTVFLSVAMLALTFSMQFMFAQFGMSDAEAALFGTAGITSAPEMFVAMGGGPIVPILLLAGSNVIDGWISALGQVSLISVVSLFDGQLVEINLDPSISYLTLLSWTQGMFVWLLLWIYARFKSRTMMAITIVLLALANFYYFFNGWLSAQAIGVQSVYAQNHILFEWLTNIINLFS